MDKLSFYDILPEYVNYLRDFENNIRGFSHVPLVNYEEQGRNRKFFCGIVLQINEFQYYVPVSSYTENHAHTYYLYEKTRRIASLRFDYMFPVPKDVLSLKNIKDVAGEGTLKYQRLLGQELAFCRKNESVIREYALRTYLDVLTPVKAGARDYRDRSNNFRLLEGACQQYCQEKGIALDITPCKEQQKMSLAELCADAKAKAALANQEKNKYRSVSELTRE